MDVTPQELRSSEIKDSWRGYDRDEVDDLLERAAVTIESLTQDLQEAASRPAPAAAAPVAAAAPAEVPLPSNRDDAEMLQRTLLLAQRAADDAVNEAQARSKQMLEESEAKAQALVSDAEATARRIAEGERRRLEAELLDLSARREQLRTDADALEEYVAGYRDRIRAAIEDDLAKLGGEVEPPSDRPELHEVEIPIERDPAPTAVGRGRGRVRAGSRGRPHLRTRACSRGSIRVATATGTPAPATRAISGLDSGPETGPFTPEASAVPLADRGAAATRAGGVASARTDGRSATGTFCSRGSAPAPAAPSCPGSRAGRGVVVAVGERRPTGPPPRRGTPPRRGSATPRSPRLRRRTRSRPTCRWRPTRSTPTPSTTTRSSRRCGKRCATTRRSARATRSRPQFFDSGSEQDRRRFRRRR